jgi:hypothetical protein
MMASFSKLQHSITPCPGFSCAQPEKQCNHVFELVKYAL